MPVNENLKAIREAKGVTKTYLANRLGMSLPGYAYLEQGTDRITVERMRAIAKWLGEPIAVFFDDELTKTVIQRYSPKDCRL